MEFYRTLPVATSDEWKVYEWKVYEWKVYEWTVYEWKVFKLEVYEWTVYEWKVYKWKVYEWKVYEWKAYEWKVHELKIAENQKQPSNVFLIKWNEKCTQPNKKVVTSDSKCTWSNVNLGYRNVTIQL